MLRYQYENSYDFTVKRCKDCLKYDNCKFYIKKASYNESACMNAKFNYKRPEITDNVDWLLFQIARDSQLYLMQVKTLKRQMLTDWTNPESLKDYDIENGPSIKECRMFEDMIRIFSNSLFNKIKEFETLKRDSTGTIADFIRYIISTRILVKNNIIYLYVAHDDILKEMRNRCLDEDYKFKVISNFKDEMKDEWSNV